MLENLYEQLFDLRNQQANCSTAERAEIQREIQEVLAQIDANS